MSKSSGANWEGILLDWERILGRSFRVELRKGRNCLARDRAVEVSRVLEGLVVRRGVKGWR